MHRTEERWTDAYKERGALWFHDGNPKRPHSLLTSGNHSNGFFNSSIVIEDDQILREAVADLIELFVEYRKTKALDDIDLIVGPQTGPTKDVGAAKMARFLSERINELGGDLLYCDWAAPEKATEDGKNILRFNGGVHGSVASLDRVIPCDDVLTTGGSVVKLYNAIHSRSGRLSDAVLILVNRSGLQHVEGKGILALITKELPIWTPEECPLCKEGSVAIHPKVDNNWTLLNAEY